MKNNNINSFLYTRCVSLIYKKKYRFSTSFYLISYHYKHKVHILTNIYIPQLIFSSFYILQFYKTTLFTDFIIDDDDDNHLLLKKNSQNFLIKKEEN